MMINIQFADGSVKSFAKGISAEAIATAISPSLRKRCLAAEVNGVLTDLTRPIETDAKLILITEESPVALEIIRHSSAHLMAQAIKTMYPWAQFGVGPNIEEGFYYDIDLGDTVLTDTDLPEIEKVMTKLVAQSELVSRREVSKAEALSVFKNDIYKTELINDLPDGDIITLYSQGDFTDLCRGPHVPSTKWLKHFKLLSLAGAYWRGDSKNKQLTRIYGTSFFTAEALTDYLTMVEERKKRDHRKLGKELDLFMLSEYGPGFPFWLPNGMILRRELENFWYKVHLKEGYKLIQTPIMLNKELWEVSGHWTIYREHMYTSTIDDQEYAIKPMNCPGGMLVYKHDIHSYKDFPLKIGELGLVHRHEASGALNGLFRVRNFTQDDAHIFMTEAMIVHEVSELVRLYDYMYSVFGLSYQIELSTRPLEKYIGEISTWDRAEKALADALISMGKEFKINPGDGAFYGPKLDFKLQDSMNRIWQCGTIQLDMNLPERFELTYIDQNGEKKRPVMLHRALFGSIERFIGILIEHYAGAFPTWLAPVQIKVIPVNIAIHKAYAEAIKVSLLENDFRVEADYREEKLGYKIREAQTKKIPYQLVIGDKEVADQTITYRRYGELEQITVSITDFIKMVKQEIANK
ncbi:MAG: threonine--tRNA ligase [Candidatus Izemoplasmatales bacterium]|nr:threonine--tRNA ligase [Candidatus Izemoplasmatales bacterium]MDD3865871.1 threonine--tRNA ligase [Candidatus Izemoplasmatales bacterium]